MSDAPPLWLEVVARHGAVLERRRLTGFPLRIGRGYDNDVVIDDPYVAAHHLTLEWADGVVSARDTGTVNGSFEVAPAHRGGWARRRESRAGTIVLRPGVRVRIGQTLIALRWADEPVPAAVRDGGGLRWEGAVAGGVALAAVAAWALFQAWVADTRTDNAVAYVSRLAATLGLVLVWAGFWAAMNRLFGGRAHFGRQLAIGAALLLGAGLYDELAGLLGFTFGWGFWSRYDPLPALLLLAWALYYHLLGVVSGRRIFAGSLAGGLVAVAVVVLLANRYATEQQWTSQPYMSALRPPGLRLTGEVPSAGFFDSARELKADLDEKRKRAPADAEDD